LLVPALHGEEIPTIRTTSEITPRTETEENIQQQVFQNFISQDGEDNQTYQIEFSVPTVPNEFATTSCGEIQNINGDLDQALKSIKESQDGMLT